MMFGGNVDTRKFVDCQFFLKGNCQKGDLCPFRHDPSKVLQKVDMRSNIDCLFFQKGKCTRGSLCPYRHDIGGSGWGGSGSYMGMMDVPQLAAAAADGSDDLSPSSPPEMCVTIDTVSPAPHALAARLLQPSSSHQPSSSQQSPHDGVPAMQRLPPPVLRPFDDDSSPAVQAASDAACAVLTGRSPQKYDKADPLPEHVAKRNKYESSVARKHESAAPRRHESAVPHQHESSTMRKEVAVAPTTRGGRPKRSVFERLSGIELKAAQAEAKAAAPVVHSAAVRSTVVDNSSEDKASTRTDHRNGTEKSSTAQRTRNLAAELVKATLPLPKPEQRSHDRKRLHTDTSLRPVSALPQPSARSTPQSPHSTGRAAAGEPSSSGNAQQHVDSTAHIPRPTVRSKRRSGEPASVVVSAERDLSASPPKRIRTADTASAREVRPHDADNAADADAAADITWMNSARAMLRRGKRMSDTNTAEDAAMQQEPSPSFHDDFTSRTEHDVYKANGGDNAAQHDERSNGMDDDLAMYEAMFD